MTNKELLEYNKHRKVCQICLATDRDLDEVLQEWVDILKVGPWTVVEVSNETVTDPRWNGKPVTEPFMYKCATAMYGNIQMEIVKPCYGVTMAEDFVKRKGTGLQHFKEYIADEDMQERISELLAAGLQRTNSGHFSTDYFCNFDSEKALGFSLEVGNFAQDVILPEGKYYIFPREDQQKNYTIKES
jgi:hypothetical protein